MKPEKVITVVQATSILVSTIVGVGVLPLPLFAVQAAETGAPFATVVAMAIASVGLVIVTLLGMRFPKLTFSELSERIIGKWLAAPMTLLIVSFFAVLSALAAREFGTVVVTSVLKNTPIEVTVFVMLLLATLSARADMRSFSYMHMFYLPVVLVPALIIVVLSLKNSNMLYLMPIFGNHRPDFFGGVFTIAALFQGYFIMTNVIPCMRRPRKAMIASILGMGIAGGLYLLLVVAVVAVFGPMETKNLLWPTLELAKTTALPANVLERLDAAFLSVWVTAVFTTLLSSYYLTVRNMTGLLRLKDHKPFTFFTLPFVFLIAMLPENVLNLYRVIEIVGRIGLVLTLLYPGALLLIAALRGVRGEAS
ncbi:endospore germination permease [Paenibacillus sp.]|uniref:GerAB/ArcD/ProY family transporter n=1 Tax=Paenibacillus sp. TaxID=58172 RepID=UPI002811BA5D|nr:endospore germination permease [Paenibacillus sp.]